MSKFSFVDVFPSYPNYTIVQWDIEHRCLYGDIYFNVFQSESPEGEYVLLNSRPIKNTFSYSFPFPLLFKMEYVYVIVEAIIDGKSYKSEPQGLYNRLNKSEFLTVREIMYGKNLVRHKIYGVNVHVMKRRNFGLTCAECIDPATDYVINSKCDSCFGTRIVGGFFPPIPAICEIDEQGTRDVKPTQIGNMDNVFARIHVTYPLLQRGDVIIELNRNSRWYINTVNREMFAGFPFDQIADGRKISPKDIEYSIKLDVEKEHCLDYDFGVKAENDLATS